MIPAPSGHDRHLLKGAEQGDRLPSIDDPRGCTLDTIDQSPGRGCDSTQLPQEVQREPLASEDRTGWASDRGEPGARLNHVSIGDQGAARDLAVQKLENSERRAESGDASGVPRDEMGCRLSVFGNRGIGG
jgi:hypothetical protein